MEFWQWFIYGWIVLGVIVIGWMYIACENAPIIEDDHEDTDNCRG